MYRQCAVCYTDFWAAYALVIPRNRHRAVGKESGQTNYIERFKPADGKLNFNDVLSIGAVADSDVGSYGINLVTGSGGASSSCSVELTLAPAGPVTVPTLNIWGLVIFLALLLTVHFAVRCRQHR